MLTEGEALWAAVDRTGTVTLGSGQELTIPEGLPDDLTGWRRVEILDPTRLTARVLPVAWARLDASVGDDPWQLYRPDPLPGPDQPERSRPFPVGGGPDLMALFEERVWAAAETERRRAANAEAAAERRVAEASWHTERQLAVAREAFTRDIESSKQAIEDLRGSRTVLLRALAAVVLGWLVTAYLLWPEG